MAYGPSHLAVLAVFAVGAALLVWIGRRQTEAQARMFAGVFALLILAAFVVASVYKLIWPDVQTSVPIQLSTSRMMAIASSRAVECGGPNKPIGNPQGDHLIEPLTDQITLDAGQTPPFTVGDKASEKALAALGYVIVTPPSTTMVWPVT